MNIGRSFIAHKMSVYLSIIFVYSLVTAKIVWRNSWAWAMRSFVRLFVRYCRFSVECNTLFWSHKHTQCRNTQRIVTCLGLFVSYASICVPYTHSYVLFMIFLFSVGNEIFFLLLFFFFFFIFCCCLVLLLFQLYTLSVEKLNWMS